MGKPTKIKVYCDDDCSVINPPASLDVEAEPRVILWTYDRKPLVRAIGFKPGGFK